MSWATSGENLFWGFSTRLDSNQPVKLQKQARVMKLQMQNLDVLNYQAANKKGTDQTARIKT